MTAMEMESATNWKLLDARTLTLATSIQMTNSSRLDDSCVFAQEYLDCDGFCLNDSDGDGACDELEIEGCTDASACNFGRANNDEEDGTCEYLDATCGCVAEIVWLMRTAMDKRCVTMWTIVSAHSMLVVFATDQATFTTAAAPTSLRGNAIALATKKTLWACAVGGVKLTWMKTEYAMSWMTALGHSMLVGSAMGLGRFTIVVAPAYLLGTAIATEISWMPLAFVVEAAKLMQMPTEYATTWTIAWGQSMPAGCAMDQEMSTPAVALTFLRAIAIVTETSSTPLGSAVAIVLSI